MGIVRAVGATVLVRSRWSSHKSFPKSVTSEDILIRKIRGGVKLGCMLNSSCGGQCSANNSTFYAPREVCVPPQSLLVCLGAVTCHADTVSAPNRADQSTQDNLITRTLPRVRDLKPWVPITKPR